MVGTSTAAAWTTDEFTPDVQVVQADRAEATAGTDASVTAMPTATRYSLRRKETPKIVASFVMARSSLGFVVRSRRLESF
jgi:hypothetical protein